MDRKTALNNYIQGQLLGNIYMLHRIQFNFHEKDMIIFLALKGVVA